MKGTVTLLSYFVALDFFLVFQYSSEAFPSGQLTEAELLSTIDEAKKLVDEDYKVSRDRVKENLRKPHVTPGDFLKHLKEPVGRTRNSMRWASYMEKTLQLLRKKASGKLQKPFNITDVLSSQQKEMLAKKTYCDYVVRPIRCPENSPYRTITGECNNRKHPHFGAANHGYARWLPAEYEDGFFLPRGLIQGQLYHNHPLPLVRQVSNEIITTSNENITEDEERSLAFMHWGQWVDHDMDLAPMAESSVHCETGCNYEPPCFPIKIPPGDPRIKKPGVCMPFLRTAPVCNPTTFVREQLNSITSFLDTSMVYGSEDTLARRLRNLTNDLGLMALNQNFTDAGLGLLPFQSNPNSICLRTNESAKIPCFEAGDKRVTENLGLTALHTLFVREHNRLARELKIQNPHWDGERIYQEARKINVAQNQIITVRDYLPLLLGSEMNKQIPPYMGYKDSVDPTVSNVFSLAFRFGHASIPPFVPRLDEHFQPLLPYSHVPLHQTFCTSWRIVMEGGIDPLMRGFLTDKSKLMKQNQMIVEELQEHLFEQVEAIGLDLAALNLQRGRDHGLPGYNAWRRFCGLSDPQNETELAAVLGNFKLAKKFIDLYGTPENIDIWIGAMSEPFVPFGRVGPLLACLIGTQLRKVRDGDRYWWEKPGEFSPQQQRALRSASLPRVICDNTRIQEVPRDVFKKNSYPEDFVPCREIRGIDLSAWKE